MPAFGYHGRYLRIDVSSGAAESIAIDEQVLRDYLGGVGLGAAIVRREGGAEALPLSGAAPLALVFSPLVGSPLTTSAKCALVSKSPLTDRLNDSLVSSRIAISGKNSGADALVIVGAARRPVVLVVDDGVVRCEDAGDLWGQTCSDCEREIAARYGSDFSAAVIGPAGEKLVRYATVSHDGRHAGRGGSGAVLGAKKIKAIVVRGEQRVTFAHPQQLIESARDLSDKSFGPATAKYRELGTAANLLLFNRLGVLPTRNFQAGSFPAAVALAPETLATARTKTRASCAACTIGCEHIYELAGEGPDARPEKVRLEYENLFALGPLCGIGNAEIVLRASRKCDELGLDTISTGGTIAFAMECAERGLIDLPWLRFGDGEAMLRAIDLIARREGPGDLLAEGSRRMALAIGQNAIAFAPQVKGLELPGYEPRALQSMALGFAVGSRGADHNHSGAYEVDFSDRVDRKRLGPESVHHAVDTENRAALIDSLILCKFLRGVFSDFYCEAAELLHRVTGWDVTADEMKVTAARIVAEKKRFNIAAGWTPAEDTLPERFLSTAPEGDDAARLSREQLGRLIVAYHRARGWSDDGYPPDENRATG